MMAVVTYTTSPSTTAGRGTHPTSCRRRRSGSKRCAMKSVTWLCAPTCWRRKPDKVGLWWKETRLHEVQMQHAIDYLGVKSNTQTQKLSSFQVNFTAINPACLGISGLAWPSLFLVVFWWLFLLWLISVVGVLCGFGRVWRQAGWNVSLLISQQSPLPWAHDHHVLISKAAWGTSLHVRGICRWETSFLCDRSMLLKPRLEQFKVVRRVWTSRH